MACLGRDLKTRAAHPHQEFRGVPPRAHYQLNGCLTKGTCCFIAGQSNENISHNLIIGNEKKWNCDNGLAPIQSHCNV